MTKTEPILELTIPGKPAGKKTSPTVIFPGIASLGIRKLPDQIARARQRAVQQGRSPKRVGTTIFGIQDLLEYLAMRSEDSRAVAELCLRARAVAHPKIVPPDTHRKWHDAAMATAAMMKKGPRPILPRSHMARAQCHVFLEKGQTGDLVGFLEAILDFLQDAKLIHTDHWVNSHDGSERFWTEPDKPRVEITLWDLGPKVEWKPPKVTVVGFEAFKGTPTPLRFSIETPGGDVVDRLVARGGLNRAQLIVVAMRLWSGHRSGEKLPDGSVIAVGDAKAQPQTEIF